jgi:putative membrane protein
MPSYRSLALAAAIALAVGCGNAPDESEGGGGANGLGDDARPTAAERTGGAPGSSTGASDITSKLSDEDRQFVQKASVSNQMEVSLANLAEDKAQNDDVKQYAEELARDHEAANRELQASLGGGDATTAQQPGGGVSHGNADAQGKVPPEMQQTQQKLESTSGAAFDRAYLDAMVKHHQQDIQEFERAAKSDTAQIRAFAERTLPTLRKHLERAQQLQSSQGANQQQ